MDELLSDIKNYLDITWADTAADRKLDGIIKRARSILQSYAGCELAFEDETDEQQLLFDCVRYIYSDALDEFKVNFADELFMLRAGRAVEYEEETAE